MKQEFEFPELDEANALVQETNETKDFGKAAEYFATLSKKYPLKDSLSLEAGIYYFNSGLYSKAVDFLKLSYSSADLDKDENGFRHMELLHYLGKSLYHNGEEEEALSIFEEAESYVRFYNDDPDAMINFVFYKGMTYSHNHEYSKSERVFISAQSLCKKLENPKPWESNVQFLLTKVYYFLGQFKKALDNFSNVRKEELSESFHADFHFYKILCLLRARRLNELLDEFSILESLGIPEHAIAEVYNAVGIAHFSLGDDEKAQTAFTESAKHDTPREWITVYNAWYLSEIRKGKFNPLFWLFPPANFADNYASIYAVSNKVQFVAFLVFLYLLVRSALSPELFFCSVFVTKVMKYLVLPFFLASYLSLNYWLSQVKARSEWSHNNQIFENFLTFKFVSANLGLIGLAIIICVVFELSHRYFCG